MAALLPNSELTTENKNGIISVYADGKPTDANYRDGILKKADPDSLAVQYKALLMKETAEISEMGKKKKVIYIYHNRVDDRGHTDETVCWQIEKATFFILSGTKVKITGV